MLISAFGVMLENFYCLVEKSWSIFLKVLHSDCILISIFLSFRIPPSWPGESYSCFFRDCQIIIIVCHTEGPKKSIIRPLNFLTLSVVKRATCLQCSCRSRCRRPSHHAASCICMCWVTGTKTLMRSYLC